MTNDRSDGGPLAPFIGALPVDGGSITVIARTGLSSTVATSDPVASRLDGLQLDLGEGPRRQAFRSGRPVLVPDVESAVEAAAWPMFSRGLAAAGVAGVFAIPLVLGLLRIGVIDLHSSTTGISWTQQQIDTAIGLATDVARPALHAATRSASAAAPTSSSSELRREVHQATGVLIAHLHVTPGDALALLQAYAFAHTRPVIDVAADILGHRLDPHALFG